MMDRKLCRGVRPFGVSLLVAGLEDGESKLYQVDPSGSYFGWKATAIGKNFVSAKTFLEKRYVHAMLAEPRGTQSVRPYPDVCCRGCRYNEEMEIEDAVHTALLTLKEGFEGQMTESNIELGIADKDGFRKLSPADVKDYLTTLQA